LGQGKENSKVFLLDNPDIAMEIEVRVREALGLGPLKDDSSANDAKVNADGAAEASAID
jgi:recombination protein RecA